MSKNYIKPEIDKISVDSQVIRMFSRSGFIEVFWEELQLQRIDNPKISQREVFDLLNQKFYGIFGEFRYSCYNAFKQRLNKDNYANQTGK